jgi:hypothetical protein
MCDSFDLESNGGGKQRLGVPLEGCCWGTLRQGKGGRCDATAQPKLGAARVGRRGGVRRVYHAARGWAWGGTRQATAQAGRKTWLPSVMGVVGQEVGRLLCAGGGALQGKTAIRAEQRWAVRQLLLGSLAGHKMGAGCWAGERGTSASRSPCRAAATASAAAAARSQWAGAHEGRPS